MAEVSRAQRGLGRPSRPTQGVAGQVAKSSTRRPKPKASLGAISEAAEWTEQSAAGHHDFDEELEAVWAEAGAAAGAAAPAAGNRNGTTSAASIAALALASANAARKGGLGISCHSGTADSATARRGMIQPGGELRTAPAEKVSREPDGSDPQEDSEEETSEEEVEMQEVSMPSPASSKPKEADVVELNIDIIDLEGAPTLADSGRSERIIPKAMEVPNGATASTSRGRVVVGADIAEKAARIAIGKASGAAKLSKRNCGGETERQAKVDTPTPHTKPEGEDDAEIEKEWEEIARRSEELAKEARESRGKVAAQQDALSKPISYKEVQAWLQDIASTKAVASASSGKTGSKPDGELGDEKPGQPCEEFIFHLKATPFDFNDRVHYRMLHTMYSKLARCKVCPRIGSHWEVLGFQGTDPQTDLNRSGGLLNVIHMFFCFVHFFEVFHAVFRLSQDDQQHFPLAAVSINITKIVMDELIAGSLSSEMGGTDDGVIRAAETTCRIFSSGLYHFYSRWRTQKRTIRDSEQTFKEVRAMLSSQPATLLEELDQGSKRATMKTEMLAQVEFTDLHLADHHEGVLADPDRGRCRHYQAAE